MSRDILQYIFVIIIFIFIIGALSSLLAYKQQKLSNFISNISVIAASLGGIFLSVSTLLISAKEFVHFTFKSSISLFTISFNIDRLSAFFILIISLLSLIVSIYSFSYNKHYFNTRNIGFLGFIYNLFILSMILVVTANQIFYFIIVWEIMSLSSYFLVTFENEKKDSQKAGFIYVIMTHVGTAFITASFALIYKYTGSTDFHSIKDMAIPAVVKCLIFLFALVGFGTKAGIVPLHIWLPYAHPAAPSNISALMSGVMIKTAIYGIIRVAIGVLGAEYQWWGTAILIIGAVSTILGIAYALMENNIKRLLAYSSIENIGIILIGVGLSVMAYSNGNDLFAALALTAALIHAFNHSIMKGLLFLGAGSIHYSTNTKNMEKLGGLIKRMPFTAVFVLIGAFSISGIPPMNGFVSEWLTYQSLFMNISSNGSLIRMIIILSVTLLSMAGALAIYCFVKMFGISFLAVPRSNNAKDALEVPKPMITAMGILALLCVLAGMLPNLLIKLFDGINLDVFGKGIIKKISGSSSFVLYPIKLNGSSISLISLFICAIIGISAIYLVVKFISKGKKGRTYGTWDCGYRELTPKMQYTSTGFSKPIRIVFRAIFRPQRELQVEEGTSPYFFKSAKYIVTMQSIFEKYLYEPMIKKILNFARRARLKVQTGSIHIYLIYIFIVIIGLFVYYAHSVR